MSILIEANNLINGQRQKDYGDKTANFSRIADGWNLVLKDKLIPGKAITPQEVALCMIQLKVARLCASPLHRDSALDIAGYIGCLDILNTPGVLNSTPDADADSLDNRSQSNNKSYSGNKLGGSIHGA
jgi:hypothetical protein